jgi:hypothetical protein
MITKKLTPQTARTDEQMAQLERDNISVGGFWMAVSEEALTIAAQVSGEEPSGIVGIPKYVFDQFVKMYLEG